MEWNDETVARLTTLWDEGHSTAEIARQLNMSKNAVVGKAHRIKLTPRPSPIRRSDAIQAPKRAAALKSVALKVVEPKKHMRLVPPPQEPQNVASQPVAEIVAQSPISESRYVAAKKIAPCCWPIGEPTTKGFHYCGANALLGKPYCLQHAQLAYVKVRDRRVDAA